MISSQRAVSLLFATLSLVTSCTRPAPQAQPDAAADAATTVDPRLLGLNDVSILLPLPSGPTAQGYLSASSSGAKGALLPQSVFAQIPGFPVMPSEGLEYDKMRVVSVRFDPCNVAQPGDPCAAQVRMVMQPVTAAGSTKDSALHLFYSLTSEQFAAVVTALRSLRTMAAGATNGPLDVHPVLAAQGMSGAYATALNALLLANAGEQNLTKMTFFLRAPPLQEVWFFGGFTRSNGMLTRLNIQGVGTSNQRVIHTPSDNDGFEYAFTPEATTPEDHRALLSTAQMDAATDEARRDAFAGFLRVENPDAHTVDALPCAGCHVSTFVTGRARQRFSLADEMFAAHVFRSSRHDLTVRGLAAQTPSSLRAFGYFHGDVMISQRTVNESAKVADEIERLYPLR